jgi:pimeloyl-ACP methyl ester carboxylesterase
MIFIKYFKSFVLILAVSLFVIPNVYADFNMMLPDIELQPGITADINIVVYESNSAFCQNLDNGTMSKHSIFAVHGINSDTLVFEPLARALFINNPTGGIVCRVLAMEMPGHGLSGIPQGGLLFGQMSEDNYSNIVLNSLAALAQTNNIHPISLIAHSNGGVVTQLAQQNLVNQGSSLRSEFGIEKITFFASVPSEPVAWPDAQAIADALTFQAECFDTFTPPCNEIDVFPLIIPDGVIDWDDIQALDPLQTIYDCIFDNVPIGVPMIPIAPGNCEIASTLGDRVPPVFIGNEKESLTIIREAFGVPPQQRPSTNPGIFGGPKMATLNVISFDEDDVVGPPSVHQDLHDHLSNGPNSRYFNVLGAGTGHGYIFTAPNDLLDILASNHICLIPLQKIVSPIPTLSEWGLIAMASILGIVGIIGFMVIRRRKVSA